MNYSDRIVSDHQVMLGKAVIKDTRITVELLLRKMSEGATIRDLLAMYLHVTEEDIQAALRYASA